MKKGVIHLNKAIDPKGVVAQEFINQFRLAEISSSEIEIRINCSGGSVIHGWSIVDTIQNSSVPVTGIVTGVAASMASVVFASCRHKRYMMDYSNLMMHNPRNGDKAFVEASKNQLIKFYQSAFGLEKKAIINLMNGVAGQDGTWLNASDAQKLDLIHGVKNSGRFKQVDDPFRKIHKTRSVSQGSTDFVEAMADFYESEHKSTLEEAMAKIHLLNNLAETPRKYKSIEEALEQIGNSQTKSAIA